MMNAPRLRRNVGWNVKRKIERQSDFAMAHQSVLFQVNKISSKGDGGSPNAKRKR
jgi:hypothetical protein